MNRQLPARLCLESLDTFFCHVDNEGRGFFVIWVSSPPGKGRRP